MPHETLGLGFVALALVAATFVLAHSFADPLDGLPYLECFVAGVALAVMASFGLRAAARRGSFARSGCRRA